MIGNLSQSGHLRDLWHGASQKIEILSIMIISDVAVDYEYGMLVRSDRHVPFPFR